jgi:subfamily B ATP-binding cassette protein MsbA
LRRGSASIERIEESVALSDSSSEEEGSKAFVFEKEIHFDDVSYGYESESVIKGLQLKIMKGQKVALVGPSGAGKSTIIRLLLKMINADSGVIRIDGEAISNFSKESLNKALGFVPQQSFLFRDTVRNNITMGREGFSDERIYACLELACADVFVRNLKDGLDTVIGDRGDSLSGGEKQRLTIARALLEDPEILILDEPTSALDPESEKAVSRAIINVLKDRTAIIIAHRLSTIKFVNNIFVIDSGKVIESGDHLSLSSNKGMYSQYVNIQSIA